AGRKGNMWLSHQELDKVLAEGAAWMVAHGYGDMEDLQTMEENGCLEGADPAAGSDRAKTWGLPQAGTRGSGNRFSDVQYYARSFQAHFRAKDRAAGRLRRLSQHREARAAPSRRPRPESARPPKRRHASFPRRPARSPRCLQETRPAGPDPGLDGDVVIRAGGRRGP